MSEEIYKNLILLMCAGSQAYGINSEFSDLDLRGICITPERYRDNLFESFHQGENCHYISEKFKHLANPKNPKVETTVYCLEKFLKLASDCNPNILEILWGRKSDYVFIGDYGQILINNRKLFLSKKVRSTYSGYAHAQFQKIQRHKRWIDKGELTKPERKDFGLPEVEKDCLGELNRRIRQQVSSWDFSQYGMSEENRESFIYDLWNLIDGVCKIEINQGNFPKIYEKAAISNLFDDLDLNKEFRELVLREVEYKNKLKEYSNWQKWKTTRNPERKKIEEKIGYDGKHGAHLVRLMKTGIEILNTGEIIVYREHDKEYLKAIRNGQIEYGVLENEFDKLKLELNTAYENSKLPEKEDKDAINDLYRMIIRWARIGESGT